MSETRASVSIFMWEGQSCYHCDQEGGRATIQVGDGDIHLTASQEGFLQLAKVCREAAKRIALRTFTAAQEKYDRELAEEFPEDLGDKRI